MRKHFIDNLRWMAVLLLFPYHAFMIYNDWGEGFYIRGAPSAWLSGFLRVCWPWFMPLLFVIAGISARYALEKRSAREYVRERCFRLLIPLAAGIVLLVPVQTYFAERFHNGYAGGYFAQYALFFTKRTDLTGYAGGFTPGQLWFILYLLVISLAALPLILAYKRHARKIPAQRLTVPALLPLFLIPLAMAPLLDIAGKSVGEYFALFMLGALVLSDERVQERLDKARWYLLAGFAACAAFIPAAISNGLLPGLAYDVFSRFYGWLAILALLGLGRRYLNFRNRLTGYFASAAFPVYALHQSCLVLIAYYVFKATADTALQALVIVPASFMLTLLLYEICKRIPPARLLLGMKAPGESRR